MLYLSYHITDSVDIEFNNCFSSFNLIYICVFFISLLYTSDFWSVGFWLLLLYITENVASVSIFDFFK